MERIRRLFARLVARFFGPPTPEQFAKLMMAAIRKQGVLDISFDAERFQIVRGDADDGSYVINLHNFYPEYCQLKRADRPAFLQNTAAAMFSHDEGLPEDFTEAGPNLRPRLWARSSIEMTNLDQRLRGGKTIDMPRYLVGQHLISTVVYDFPNSVRSLRPEELEQWGVSYYEALETARMNLEQQPFQCVKLGDNLYASLTGDTYDASRLLLTDKIEQMEVRGPHVVMAPNRDTLLVTGADDDVGLEMMVSLAEKALDEPRPLLNSPLRLVDGEWEDWFPPATHPLFQRFKFLAMKYLFAQYQEQKELLEKIHSREDEGLFVASYSVLKHNSGAHISYCVLSEGINTLLPRTDRILFLKDEGGIAATGTWEEVEEAVGYLFDPVDLYPIRYRVTAFPTAGELKAIGNEDWIKGTQKESE